MANTDRLEASKVAGRLARGYYALLAAHLVAVNPQSINSLPPPEKPGLSPTGRIERKDGTSHILDLRHYLDLFREDRDLQSDFLRLWAMGALLTLGDELAKHEHFDRGHVGDMQLPVGGAQAGRWLTTKYVFCGQPP